MLCLKGRKKKLAIWFATIFIASGPHFAGAAGLFEYYSKALQADPDYATARHAYSVDIKSRDLAASAYMPSLNFTVSADQYQYQREDLTNTSVSRGFNPTTVALRLTQPLFSMDRQAYRSENEARAARAEWVLLQARQDLMTRLVQTVFNYLLGIDQLELAIAQAKAYQAQLTQVEGLLPSRSSTRTEVADARARHELALAQVKSAQSALEVRKLEFLRLTGELPTADLRPLAGNPVLQLPEPLDPQAWIDAARSRSAKVLAQNASLQMAEVGIAKAKAGNYPSLSLVAGRQRATAPNYFTSLEQTDSLSLQLNMNLFDGGNTRTLTDQAVAQSERARSELQSVQHEVAAATGQAYWGVVNGVEQVRAMEKAESAAELALEGTRMGIKANVKTFADELNAVQLLYSTRRDLQKERYSYLISRVQLLNLANTDEETRAALLRQMLP